MSAINEELGKKELMQMSPICNNCKNYIKDLKCKAFNIIPDDILFYENDHSKPLPNQDNNVIFEALK